MLNLLFSPLKIRGVTLKNRIVVSPMCQYSSVDGFANDWHLVHLGSRAVGGSGLVFSEATAVVPEGRISPDDLGIWKDEHIDFLKRITNFISDNGAVPGIQLAHAGRKASTSSPWKGRKIVPVEEGGWQVVSPSASPFYEGNPTPRALTIGEIRNLVIAFAKAAERAIHAGFKIIEIHAAHGYLVNEFLSPLSNQRTDEYGGSFENRIRFLSEIVQATRKVIGEGTPLFVRISATEWVAGGWDVQDSIALAQILKNLSVDVIDCSSGGNNANQKLEVGPLYQVPFAEKVRNEANIPTGAVGMITTAEQAEEILQKGRADLIIMARQLLREPYFPLHAAHDMGEDIEWHNQYDRAKRY